MAIREVLRAEPIPAFQGAVALIGGGRWARVLLGVLCEVLPEQVSIIVCSERNAEGMRSWIAKQRHLVGRRHVEITDNPDNLRRATATILASRARDNSVYAARCLSTGQHVLIEKPFATDLATGENLIALAATRQRVLAVGLELFFASYLHVFRAVLPSRFTPGDMLYVNWSDPVSDSRYGETKRYDTSTNVVEDVFPHVWTLLALLSGEKHWQIEHVSTLRGGARIELHLHTEAVNATLVIERDAAQRRRTIEYAHKEHVLRTLNFALEPGSIGIANDKPVEDPIWGTVDGPLHGELAHFIAAIHGRQSTAMFLASDCVAMLPVIEQVTREARASQLSVVQNAVARGRTESYDPDILYALRENVVLDLENCGLVHADTPSIVLQDAVVMLLDKLNDASRRPWSPDAWHSSGPTSNDRIAAAVSQALNESRFVQQVLGGPTKS